MNFHLYQIIVALLSGVMIYQGITKYLKGSIGQTFFKLMIRTAVWGGMALIAIFPGLTNVIAQSIGIEGNINAVILTGFILIFLMIFKLLSAIERLEQNITDLTKKEALSELENK